mmetsp:Transcript_10320/g.15798  ORF Transcript_10320/g.15798 Transcript_10320/m.15798 type:complete len:109 (-) Transcript_10320:2936-3262(-)
MRHASRLSPRVGRQTEAAPVAGDVLDFLIIRLRVSKLELFRFLIGCDHLQKLVPATTFMLVDPWLERVDLLDLVAHDRVIVELERALLVGAELLELPHLILPKSLRSC